MFVQVNTYINIFLLYFVLLHFFFFNDTATTEIYTLSLHDALPIWYLRAELEEIAQRCAATPEEVERVDRKSTRLNSSHGYISYAVFCLKKKKIQKSCPTSTANDNLTATQHNRLKVLSTIS